jgi:hypothetical protein
VPLPPLAAPHLALQGAMPPPAAAAPAVWGLPVAHAPSPLAEPCCGARAAPPATAVADGALCEALLAVRLAPAAAAPAPPPAAIAWAAPAGAPTPAHAAPLARQLSLSALEPSSVGSALGRSGSLLSSSPITHMPGPELSVGAAGPVLGGCSSKSDATVALPLSQPLPPAHTQQQLYQQQHSHSLGSDHGSGSPHSLIRFVSLASSRGSDAAALAAAHADAISAAVATAGAAAPPQPAFAGSCGGDGGGAPAAGALQLAVPQAAPAPGWAVLQAPPAPPAAHSGQVIVQLPPAQHPLQQAAYQPPGAPGPAVYTVAPTALAYALAENDALAAALNGQQLLLQQQGGQPAPGPFPAFPHPAGPY